MKKIFFFLFFLFIYSKYLSPKSSEFVINIGKNPCSCTTGEGNSSVIVVGYNRKTNSTSENIFIQKFFSNGDKNGEEIQISFNKTDLIQTECSVSCFLVSGEGFNGFVVVWKSFGIGDSSHSILGRVFNGVNFSDVFNVFNTTNNGLIQDNAKVEAMVDGGFTVFWNMFNYSFGGGDAYDVYSKRFDVGKQFVYWENPILVNTITTGSQFRPSSCILENGKYVVVYKDDQSGVAKVQMFMENGTKFGYEFNADTYAGASEVKCSKIKGGFIVVYTTNNNPSDNSSNGVAFQRFNLSGSPIGGEILVNQYTLNEQKLDVSNSVIFLPNYGGFIISWISNGQDGDNWGIYARLFSNDSVPEGDEFCVSNYTNGLQEQIAVTWTNNGAFFNFLYSNKIYGRIYDLKDCLKVNYNHDCSGCIEGFDINTNCSSCLGNRNLTNNCNTCNYYFIDIINNCNKCSLDIIRGLSDCTGCIEGFDANTNCTTCRNFWVDELKNCSKCPTNFNVTDDCNSCEGNFEPHGNCSICPGNWDASQKCDKCLGNWNKDYNCDECLGNWDKNKSCTLCKNYYYDRGDNCGYCYPNFENDCSNCKAMWFDENKNCTLCPSENFNPACDACMGNWDLLTNCTSCENYFYNEDNDCNSCFNNFEQGNCLTCINHWTNVSNNCWTCPLNWNKDLFCDECLGNYDREQDCSVCLNYYFGYNCLECQTGFNEDCSDCSDSTLLISNNCTFVEPEIPDDKNNLSTYVYIIIGSVCCSVVVFVLFFFIICTVVIIISAIKIRTSYKIVEKERYTLIREGVSLKDIDEKEKEIVRLKKRLNKKDKSITKIEKDADKIKGVVESQKEKINELKTSQRNTHQLLSKLSTLQEFFVKREEKIQSTRSLKPNEFPPEAYDIEIPEGSIQGTEVIQGNEAQVPPRRESLVPIDDDEVDGNEIKKVKEEEIEIKEIEIEEIDMSMRKSTKDGTEIKKVLEEIDMSIRNSQFIK